MKENNILEAFAALGLPHKAKEPYHGPEHFAKQCMSEVEPDEESAGVTTTSSYTLIEQQKEED